MSPRPDDDGGDRHRCSACGALDMDEMRQGQLHCLACGAVDGEFMADEQRAAEYALLDRISSADTDPPPHYGTETP